MHSCFYEGRVAHRRERPVVHAFQYGLFMAYVDLAELRQGQRFPFDTAKWAPACFRCEDHLRGRTVARPTSDSAPSPGPDAALSRLEQSVRDLVQQSTGQRPEGPIRLLTQLRTCGYYFSPLNLFYCFDPAGEQVEAIVAEVSNTPWQETHCYVLGAPNQMGQGPLLRYQHRKQFHVSPFMQMELRYRWRLNVPDRSLHVRLQNVADDESSLFSATLTMQRRECSAQQLTRLLLRYPLQTARISGAIYLQAARLWWKKCPYYAHPKNSTATARPIS